MYYEFTVPTAVTLPRVRAITDYRPLFRDVCSVSGMTISVRDGIGLIRRTGELRHGGGPWSLGPSDGLLVELEDGSEYVAGADGLREYLGFTDQSVPEGLDI